MPLRNSQPPRTHLLGRELGKMHSAKLGGRLPQQQRSFATVTRSP
jgi:hypothetical protein